MVIKRWVERFFADYVVWFTTWSFLGIPRPGVMVRKNHNTTRTDEEKERSKLEMELRKMSLGNTKAKQLAREDVAAVLKRKSNRAEQCDHCLKVELPDQEKFRRCARCWDKLQRSVHYCSRCVFDPLYLQYFIKDCL